MGKVLSPAARSTLLFRLVTLAAVLAIPVAAAETVIRFTMPEWREFSSGRFMHRTVVPGHAPIDLGRAGFDGYFAQNNGDFRARIRINDGAGG